MRIWGLSICYLTACVKTKFATYLVDETDGRKRLLNNYLLIQDVNAKTRSVVKYCLQLQQAKHRSIITRI